MEPQLNDIKRPAPTPVPALQSEADSINPSIHKRPRLWEPHCTEFSTNVIPECGATILDALNTDCWRLVLDYVPVGDVVRSERVSRAWQRVVRDYLAGVHKYQIVHFDLNDCFVLWRSRVMRMSSKNYRIIRISEKQLFGNMIQKMGPFFVYMFALFIDKEHMEAIAANCPNLKKLKIQLWFVDSPENLHLEILNKCKLKQLSLNLVNQGDDSSLKEIVTIETLEELIILKQDRMTGSFLTNLRTNLKTLIFIDCNSLSIEHIRSVADRLTALTRLELSYNSISTLQNAHLLLDVTPNLERLCLEYYENRGSAYKKLVQLGSEVPTAIGRLNRLRELRLWQNKAVTDEWLAIVARGCPALRIVDIGRTWVSARGLLALCRERPELVELGVSSPVVKDEDLEACARYCAGLELLDASYCHSLTTSLPARLSWPRARPLRLRLFDALPEKLEVNYNGVKLLWDRVIHNSWPD